jgi:hypothetical protein
LRLYQILLLFVCFFAFIQEAFSAPDPNELIERKERAALIIEGTVSEDILVEDRSSEQTQIRKMGIEILKILEQKHSIDMNQPIQVQYHYLPNWAEYSGGKTIQVVKGDTVKLWLEEKDGAFTPVLGGYGVEVINLNGERVEHIPEPFFHKVERIWEYSWLKHSSLIVFLLISMSLVLILKIGCRNMG